MLKKFASLLLLVATSWVAAQNSTANYQKHPVFPECEGIALNALEDCFNDTLKQFVFDNFKMPEIVASENYQGSMNVFFEVDKEGGFKVLYVDAIYDELKDEMRRVFNELPQIAPANYNGKPSVAQFTMPTLIPMAQPSEVTVQTQTNTSGINTSGQVSGQPSEDLSNEYDDIERLNYANEEYTSNINIPLSHHNYSLFDRALNQIGTNSHTAQKPFIYSEVNKYRSFEEANQKILKTRSTWLGRKWWNEGLLVYAGSRC